MWMETSAQHFKRTTPTEVSFGLYESRDVHSPTDQRACGVVVTPLDRNALPKEMERARRKVAEWRNASKTGGGGGVSTDDAFTNSRAEYKNIQARAVLQDVREERQRQGQGRRIGEIHLLPFYAITATRGNLHPGGPPYQPKHDCTHYTYSPYLYEPLVCSMSLVVELGGMRSRGGM